MQSVGMWGWQNDPKDVASTFDSKDHARHVRPNNMTAAQAQFQTATRSGTGTGSGSGGGESTASGIAAGDSNDAGAGQSDSKSQSQPQSLQLFVRSVYDNNRLFVVQVTSSDSVDVLKQRIYQVTGHHMDEQIITFLHKSVESGRQLTHYELNSGSELSLRLRFAERLPYAGEEGADPLAPKPKPGEAGAGLLKSADLNSFLQMKLPKQVPEYQKSQVREFIRQFLMPIHSGSGSASGAVSPQTVEIPLSSIPNGDCFAALFYALKLNPPHVVRVCFTGYPNSRYEAIDSLIVEWIKSADRVVEIDFGAEWKLPSHVTQQIVQAVLVRSSMHAFHCLRVGGMRCSCEDDDTNT